MKLSRSFKIFLSVYEKCDENGGSRGAEGVAGRRQPADSGRQVQGLAKYRVQCVLLRAWFHFQFRFPVTHTPPTPNPPLPLVFAIQRRRCTEKKVARATSIKMNRFRKFGSLSYKKTCLHKTLLTHSIAKAFRSFSVLLSYFFKCTVGVVGFDAQRYRAEVALCNMRSTIKRLQVKSRNFICSCTQRKPQTKKKNLEKCVSKGKVCGKHGERKLKSKSKHSFIYSWH